MRTVVVIVVALTAVAVLWPGEVVAPGRGARAAAPAEASAAASAAASVRAAGLPAGADFGRLIEPPGAPGRLVRMRVPRARSGIRCPDGTFLPPLNGVSPSDPIPPIEREPFMPPIGEIVGRYTDDEGYEWWITEDGSAFTTRWVALTTQDGAPHRMVRLDQSDALLEGFERELGRQKDF